MNLFYLTFFMIVFTIENTFLNVYYPYSVDNSIAITVSVKEYLTNDYYKKMFEKNSILYVEKKNWSHNATFNIAVVGKQRNEKVDGNSNIVNNYSSDLSVDYSARYFRKKVNLFFNAIYYFTCSYGSDNKFSILHDELSLNSSGILRGKKIKLVLNGSFKSQLFNISYENLLHTSFLSPALFQYSLGFYMEDKKYFDKEFAFNFATVQSVIFVNQLIYDNLETDVLYSVEKGKNIINRFGLSVNYSLGKEFKNSFSIKNSGNLFFPGNDKLFTKEWFNKFNINLTNEITLYQNKMFSLSITSKFDYNRYNDSMVEWYNKISLTINIK